MTRTLRMAALLAASLGLAGCDGMNATQQRTTVGALGGAGVGGLLGSFSGNAGLGALLGAGVGAGGGYLYDQSQRQHDDDGYRRQDRPRRRN
ncbi:MAG: glycine zipper domain-containing protein [Alphaproteobacteria bacterium]|nr:glycine zipper domain-containing protein [Alphaproteobacteria bacterium]